MKLNDICEIYSGYALKEFNNDSNGFPVIKIGNIIADGSLALDDCQFTTETVNEKYFSQHGDIYIALSGATTGKIGIMLTQKKHIINQRVGIVRKKANDIPNAFIKYFLMYQTDRILQEASGCAQPNISPKQIALYEIPEFEPKEISKIVDALDNVSDIIKMRQQQLAKLDELVKARFVEMFGNYRVNDKGFECRKGVDLFKFSSGKFLSEEKRLKSGIPVYGGNGIAWYTNEHLIDYPTVIIGRVGAQCGNVHSVTEPVWITDNAIYIKEQKTTAYTLEFLTELMRMMNFYQYADFSGQPKITQKPLETLLYIMPPIELQKEYTTFVEQVNKSKVAVQKALDEAQTLFDSLMQQYFG